MSYEKLGFTSGQTLKAEHLNHMEEGIANAGGASSWNDLADKPFYEEVVSGDTLEWDGNTDGHVTVDFDGMLIVKLSDSVVTLDDMKNGANISFLIDNELTTMPYTYEQIVELSSEMGFPMIANVLFIPSNDYELGDAVFHEAGVYSIYDESGMFVSLTIHGYDGFEMKSVKCLDEKYMPKHSHGWKELNDKPFGEAVVPRLYITEEDLWDYKWVDNWRKVSDTIYSDDNLNNVKVTYVNSQGELVNGSVSTGEIEVHWANLYDAFYVVSKSDSVIIAQSITIDRNTNVGTFTHGLWLNHYSNSTFKIVSFEIPETNVLTRIDEKYLPILTSPNGYKFKLSVDDNGAVTAIKLY